MKTLLFQLLLTTCCYCQDVTPPQYNNDFSTEEAANKPHLTIEYKGKKLGFVNGSVLMFGEEKSQWDTILKTPIYISSAAVIHDNLIIANSWPLQLYSVDLINKKTTPYCLPKKLFTGKNISKFSVELISNGCFHHEESKRNYSLRKNNFRIFSTQGKQKDFKGMSNSVDVALLQDIVNEADLSRDNTVSLKELEITQNDINAFKVLLNKKQKSINEEIASYDLGNMYYFDEGADLNFYWKASDSLDKTQPDLIDNAFKKKCGVVSTSNIIRSLIIEFEDTSKLTIESSDYVPGYYYAPWTANYNGLIFETNSIKLSKMIDELTGGKFLNDKYKEKKYAIYKIADYMYNLSVGDKQ